MNKRLIVIFVCLVLLVLIVILNSTVFLLSDITVTSEGENNWYDSDDIIASSEIRTGSNIFTISKSKAINNIQQAHSAVRVVTIERIFPNKIVIHIAMRVPIIAIPVEDSNQFLITDWELNVIDVALRNSEQFNNSTEIIGVEVTVEGNPTELVGTQLELPELGLLVTIAYTAGSLGLMDYSFNTFIDTIDMTNYGYVHIKTNTGVTFVLVNSDNLDLQFQAVYSIFVDLDPADSRRNNGYFYNNEGWRWSANLP